MIPPKFATRRDPSRPTLGARTGPFARIWLRQPLMPWQQLVADVAGELLPNGRLAYPLVVVTVQRQAGKSHLSLARKAERCLSVPGYRSWYTAQTGGDARDQFLKFGESVAATPLDRVTRTLVGNGREVMHFLNGSTLRPHPPTEQALHGKQSDDNDVDEAWAHSEEEGKAILQAIAPTQLTRPRPQTWIWSAGGTAESTWLASLVARIRDGDPAICGFEWGIPDELALDDLQAIAEHHPAYGHLVTVDSIRALRTQLVDDSEFARAAGNRWTEVIGGAIRWGIWEQVRHPAPLPDEGAVGYGAARSADGTQVAIAAAARTPDGLVVAELLDVLPGAWGAADRVRHWATDGPVAIAKDGPSAALVEDLTGWRRLMAVDNRGLSVAFGDFLDAIDPKARAYRFRPHPDLDAGVRVLGKRSLGDGGYVPARIASGAPIAAPEAVVLACHALSRAPRPIGKPRLVTAS